MNIVEELNFHGQMTADQGEPEVASLYFKAADRIEKLHRALASLNHRAHTNYDFNADPDRITASVGAALNLLVEPTVEPSEDAAALLALLAPWEGEDADAQIIIERALRDAHGAGYTRRVSDLAEAKKAIKPVVKWVQTLKNRVPIEVVCNALKVREVLEA